ncbi:hypothetical protein Pan258_12600 [Symmachiella dynata]|nr:hypothetical protein Pan258_12600 [Symmachiella dynata]
MADEARQTLDTPIQLALESDKQCSAPLDKVR